MLILILVIGYSAICRLHKHHVRNGVNHDADSNETDNTEIRREVEQNADGNHESFHGIIHVNRVEPKPNTSEIHEIHFDDDMHSEEETKISVVTVLDSPGNVSESQNLIMSASNESDTSDHVAWMSVPAVYGEFAHKIRPTESVSEYANMLVTSLENAPAQQYDNIHGKLLAHLCMLYISLFLTVQSCNNFILGVKIHQSGFYNAANKTAQVPFLDHKLLECDCKGLEYTNKYHDITLRVPEGAVEFGRKIHFEFAVTMYGPFSFPENTQPTSPIIWLCILEEDAKLKKPFLIILPHYLTGLTNETVEQHHTGFAKANHKDCTWKDGQMWYEFQLCHDIKPLFARSGNKSYGILTSKHCCFYCLLGKKTHELAMNAGYMLVRIESTVRHTQYEIYFCAIFCLDTCYQVSCSCTAILNHTHNYILQSLNEQFPNEDGYRVSICREFKFNTAETDSHIRMVIHTDDRSAHALLIGLQPTTAMVL